MDERRRCPIATGDEESVGSVGRRRWIAAAIQVDGSEPDDGVALQMQLSRWLRGVQPQRAVNEHHVQVTNRLAGGDANPSIAKRKRVAGINEIQRDERVTARAEVKGTSVGLVIDDAASPAVARRHVAGT